MATRILTTDSVVTSSGATYPPSAIVTLADDALASALIASGRAVAVPDATTCGTLFSTDNWVAIKVGS